MNKLITTSLLAAAAAISCAQVNLVAQNITAMRYVNGQAVAGSPVVGENVAIKVDWVVQGYDEPQPYIVRVTMGGQTQEQTFPSSTSYFRSATFVFKGGFDTTVTAEAILDPTFKSGEAGSTRQDNDLSLAVTPQAINRAIEYYSPVTWNGEIRRNATMSSVQAGATMEVAAPYLVSDSFQKVVSSRGFFQRSSDPTPYSLNQVSADASGMPAWYGNFNAKAGMFTVYTAATVTTSNVRINRALINTTWAQIDSLKNLSLFNYYTQSQTSAQSTSATIQSYVTSTLGANYRSTMTPMEASRRLFQRVVRDVTYYAGADKPWNAISVLQQGRGDCAGYALLYQACMRNIGIPTRMVAGCWANETFSAHCWSEFWMPGAGWVPADACGSRGLDPSGDTLYQFGIIPNLNSRIGLSRGVQLVAGTMSNVVLQGPWMRTYGVSATGSNTTATWSKN